MMKFKLSTITGLAVILTGCISAAASAKQVPVPGSPTPDAPNPPPAPGDNPRKPDKSSQQHIIWAPTYDEALQTASDQHKPVMAVFCADWTTACHYLDDNIFTSPDVIQESRKFINVRIDTDKQDDLTKLYKVYSLPTIIFMDGNGNVLFRLEGAPEKSSYFVDVMKKAYQKFEAE